MDLDQICAMSSFAISPVFLLSLRKEGESFHLEKLHMTEKETPIEIVEMEMEVSGFLKKGVTKITREGGFKDDHPNQLAHISLGWGGHSGIVESFAEAGEFTAL